MHARNYNIKANEITFVDLSGNVCLPHNFFSLSHQIKRLFVTPRSSYNL